MSMPRVPLLETAGLVVALGPRRLAVPDLALAGGQCWAVLGSNGAGKTSLLEALAGLRTPSSGQVRWDARPCAALDAHAWRRLCGMMPAIADDRFDEPVIDRVAKGAAPATRWLPDAQARARASAMLDDLDLHGFGSHRWRTLSAGERQRALLAQRLLQAPRALLLDEPTAHQDPHHQDLIGARLDAFVRDGGLVVAVAHDPDWALAFCSHAMLLRRDGRCVAGRVEALLDAANLEAVYASRFARLEFDGRSRIVRLRGG